MQRVTDRKFLKLLGLFLGLTLLAAACSGDDDDEPARDRESDSREGTYEQLVEDQPAETMSYSPSRETINGWISTWGEPNKLSFVYLQNADGEMIGYYVLKGLPVSYCASLTPNYETIEIDGQGENVEAIVPAPGVDGVYYSGGQCSVYYGFDATTGAYMEWSLGLGINQLVYDQPLPLQNVPQNGPTGVNDVDVEPLDVAQPTGTGSG